MKAFLFPGQASQDVGMGQDLYERFSEARALFDEADEILGFALTEVCFSGPMERMEVISDHGTRGCNSRASPMGAWV